MKKIQVKPAISTITRKFESKKSKGTRTTSKNDSSKSTEPDISAEKKRHTPEESMIVDVGKDYNGFTKDPIERPPSYQSHMEHDANIVVPDSSVRGLWHEFRSDTTMHGLKHASQIQKYKLSLN